MKNSKNNDTKKLIMSIVAVVMIALLASGGTYAWWSWQSNTANGSNEKTNVYITIPSASDITFTIAGNNATGVKLAPISTCYDANYTLTGNATATFKNNSSAAATGSIVLKATLTPRSGVTFNDTQKSHIHWAIRQTDTSDTTYTAAKCGESNSTSFSTGTFTGYTNGNDITTTVTFPVSANLTTAANKYYQLYVWIDSDYSYKNVGSNAVTDPMQGLRVTLTFSTSSKIQ